MKKLALLSVFLALPLLANTPGRHTIHLTWNPGACTVAGTCFTRIYRAQTANVCAGQPTPLADNVQGAFWDDLNPPVGDVFYNVSNVDPAKGGESTCDGEVRQTVQPITTDPHKNLAGIQN